MNDKINNAIREIRDNGYFLFENVLDENKCNFYKTLLERDFKKYSKKYAKSSNYSTSTLSNKDLEKTVYNLHNKDLAYYELFDHPLLLEVLDVLLKEGSYLNSEPYHLINISARNPHIKAKGQQLHLDSNLPGGKFPLIYVALWMLDDFTKDNGATRIIPKSHLSGEYAEDNKEYPNQKIVEGKRGSLLLFNGDLWHGSSDKLINGDRWAVILGYGRWFIKPSFDFVQCMPKEIWDNLDDRRKDLLGFKSCPPKDEFTRITRRSADYSEIQFYNLPQAD